ncbi:MAG: hypothetical protein HYZ51_02250 [Candidatus Doudnabacteria bacterium]|nr:hypothetical protein [Candidatus Doudnabacteria bacterium]
MLSTAKNNAIAELFRDIGNIFFASLFIGPFITNEPKIFLIITGILLSGLSWFFGIKIIKG